MQYEIWEQKRGKIQINKREYSPIHQPPEVAINPGAASYRGHPSAGSLQGGSWRDCRWGRKVGEELLHLLWPSLASSLCTVGPPSASGAILVIWHLDILFIYLFIFLDIFFKPTLSTSIHIHLPTLLPVHPTKIS